MSNKLLTKLRRELRLVADPIKAPQMQAYMKSIMPYHGVPAPILRKICKNVFDGLDLPSSFVWQEQMLGLWRDAKFREERYSSLYLAGIKQARSFQTPEAMKAYEEMIVTGACWDYVDDLASHRIGPIVRDHPAPMRKKMLTWSKCPDMWKRRTAILCQLTFKEDTDLAFLYACIAPSLESSEFFLRKAIGWALREYAWTDPTEVIRYVREHKNKLSPLSKREALKNVLKSGKIQKIP